MPWREAIHSTTVGFRFHAAPVWTRRRYALVTVLILWTTFASVFAVLPGYWRVPKRLQPTVVFSRLHPTKNFPSFSVVFRFLGWALRLLTSGVRFMVAGLVLVAFGALAYLWRTALRRVAICGRTGGRIVPVGEATKLGVIVAGARSAG